MRLVKDVEPPKLVPAREHQPESYFNAIVARVGGPSEDTETSDAAAHGLRTIFRDASRRAAEAFAEARQRLAA